MPALSVTWTAPLQLWYAACGTVQVLYAFALPYLLISLLVARIVGKLDAKDSRVRALEEERREVQKKIETQRKEFAERMELLKADHETVLAAVTKVLY